MDLMKVQNKVRARQRGCKLESKLRNGPKADRLSSRYTGRVMSPELGRGKRREGARAAVVTGGRSQA